MGIIGTCSCSRRRSGNRLLRDASSDHSEQSTGSDPVHERPDGWITTEERLRIDIDATREKILDALRRAGGDKSLAARILGCSRMTLYRRMRRLEIDYRAGHPDEPQSVH